MLSIVVNDGSQQRSVVRSITITFTTAVTFANNDPLAAFQLTRVLTWDGDPENPTLGDVTLSATVSADAEGRTVVVLTFSGAETVQETPTGVNPSLIDGWYRLTVFGAAVTGSNGLALDGDGDRVAGGNRVDYEFRLYGDYNADRVVDPADIFPALQDTLFATSADPNFDPAFDWDGNGVVDPADLFPYIQQRLFVSLPDHH